MIGSVVLILAFAESAFADFKVVSRTDQAGIVFEEGEDQGKTTIEGDPALPVSRTFLDLAQKLIAEKEN